MSRAGRAVFTIVVAAALLGASYAVIHERLGKEDSGIALSDHFRLDIRQADANAAPREFDRRTFEDFPVFKARQGETLTLTIHSERRGSIHIHGYEKSIELVPHGDVTLQFVATDAGLFPIHLHGADNGMEHLATFEIRPK
jgi:hypothetical protein